jgi:hypothetical protein
MPCIACNRITASESHRFCDIYGDDSDRNLVATFVFILNALHLCNSLLAFESRSVASVTIRSYRRGSLNDVSS